MFLTAQIFGFLFLTVTVINYFQTDKKKYLAFNILMNTVYAIQCLFLEQYVAIIMCCFAIFRATLFIFKDKNKFIQSIYCPIILNLISIILGTLCLLLTSFNWYDIFPIISSLIIVWSTWQDNLKIIRIANIISNLCYLIFDILILAYFSIIADIVCIIATCIAIYINDISKKHDKTKTTNLQSVDINLNIK